MERKVHLCTAVQIPEWRTQSTELSPAHTGFRVSVPLQAVPRFSSAPEIQGLSLNLDRLGESPYAQFEQTGVLRFCKDQQTPVISSTSSSTEAALCQDPGSTMLCISTNDCSSGSRNKVFPTPPPRGEKRLKC